MRKDNELMGTLAMGESNGKLVQDEGFYKAIMDAFRGCAVEVHAVYMPEKASLPGWFSAAVDLFRPGQTYRVYFSHEGNHRVRIEHLERWFFG